MVIIIEGEFSIPQTSPAEDVVVTDDVEAPLPTKKTRINQASRAKIGDLVRYTPYYPERKEDEYAGVIVSINTTWLGNKSWAIQDEASEHSPVRRFASGGSIMIIREAI